MTMLDPHLDVDQLSAAVDGTRDAAVAAHLLNCLTCREQVETWRRSLAQLRALDTGPTPEARPAVDRAIAKAMDEWRPAVVPPRRRRLPFTGIAASVAAVLLVAGVAVGIVESSGGGGGSASSGNVSSAGGASSGAPSNGASSGAGGASGAGGTSGRARSTAGPTASSGEYAPMVAGDKGVLTSELRRLVKGHAPAAVPAGTPCDHQAKLLASTRVTGPSPATLTVPVTYQGVRGRVFVFSHGQRYVAFVLRSSSCDLLTTVAF